MFLEINYQLLDSIFALSITQSQLDQIVGMPLWVKIWKSSLLNAYLIKITPFNRVWESLPTH